MIYQQENKEEVCKNSNKMFLRQRAKTHFKYLLKVENKFKKSHNKFNHRHIINRQLRLWLIHKLKVAGVKVYPRQT
jgi:hypothetical protein